MSTRIQVFRYQNEKLIHPAWIWFIKECEKLQFGEIEKVTIVNGIPTEIQLTRKKVRFEK